MVSEMSKEGQDTMGSRAHTTKFLIYLQYLRRATTESDPSESQMLLALYFESIERGILHDALLNKPHKCFFFLNFRISS